MDNSSFSEAQVQVSQCVQPQIDTYNLETGTGNFPAWRSALKANAATGWSEPV